MDRSATDAPMSVGQRWSVAVLLVAALILGVAVEWRSVFMSRRMTDVGCYIRAAWAVRAGNDLYDVTDDNGWHYNYPPFLAIVMAPLAEAPGQQPVAALPYPVSVALWYVIGFGSLLLAAHYFAIALESGQKAPTRRIGYAWWSLRLVPLFVVLPAAGRALARGQVNTIVLALLASWTVARVSGRRTWGGAFLAVAASIKVIPAFLFLHPIWRRDGRSLVGVALGFSACLIFLPVFVSGPETAFTQVKTFLDVTLRPGLGSAGDTSRANELTDVTATDSQSILCVLHNLRYTNPWARSTVVEPWTRAVHWTIAGLLTLGTLVIHGRKPRTPQNELTFIGALAVVMTVIAPVSHLHYLVFAMPLVAALHSRGPSKLITIALGFFVLANVASLLPVLFFRMYGLTTMAALLLWLVALVPETAARENAATIDERNLSHGSKFTPHAA